MSNVLELMHFSTSGKFFGSFAPKVRTDDFITPVPLYELSTPEIDGGDKFITQSSNVYFIAPVYSEKTEMAPTFKSTLKLLSPGLIRAVTGNAAATTPTNGIDRVQDEFGTIGAAQDPTYDLVKGVAPISLTLMVWLWVEDQTTHQGYFTQLSRVDAGDEVAGVSYSLDTATLTFAVGDAAGKIKVSYAYLVANVGYNIKFDIDAEGEPLEAYIHVRATNLDTGKKGNLTIHLPNAQNVSPIKFKFPDGAYNDPIPFELNLLNDFLTYANYKTWLALYFTEYQPTPA